MNIDASMLEPCSYNNKQYYVALLEWRVVVLDPDDGMYVQDHDLPMRSWTMGLEPGCARAVVVHDSFFTIVSLFDNNANQVMHTGLHNIYHILINADNIAHFYTFVVDSWDPYCLDLGSFELMECKYCGIYNDHGSTLYMHPNKEWFYSLAPDGSSIYKHTFQKDTCAKFDEHADGDTFGTRTWFSYDGSRLLTSRGRVASAETLRVTGVIDGEMDAYYSWFEASQVYPYNVYIIKQGDPHIKVYR